MPILSNLKEPAKQTPKTEKSRCSVCGGGGLDKLWDLPKLPLTGIYVDKPCSHLYPPIDQALMRCPACGHAQLLYAVAPESLYGRGYSHRSSGSAIATDGNDFFIHFLETLAPGRRFKNAVEIGSNDLYLLRKIRDKADRLTAIDPVWLGEAPPTDSKIKVIGKFVEEVDFPKELNGAPDLVLSSHTLEHLDEPSRAVRKLMDLAAPGALFVVEVPGFDSLLKAGRFDQVFHQHIQYFSLGSFQRWIEAIGGEYKTHTFNYAYWNGTMLVAFVKSAASRRGSAGAQAPPASQVEQSLRLFQKRMGILKELLDSLRDPVVGYGAAQMLPVLAYHLKSDLGFLQGILDDNPARDGLMYPDLAPRIRMPEAGFPWDQTAVLITALDSVRPILKRLLHRPIKHVINPMQIF